jgi:hypothetical protein
MGFTYTANLTLAKPDAGEPGANWGPAVNNNFDSIDTNIAKSNPDVFRVTGSTRNRRYLGGHPASPALTTAAPTANVLRAVPIWTGNKITLDRIGINVTTLTAGNQRLGIYNDNANGYPGTLVADLGTVDTGTTGVKEITISQILNANTLYWLALVGNAAPTIRAIAGTAMFPILGLDSGLGTALGVGWTVAFTYAALPSTFTAGGSALTTADTIPAIAVRVLS